MRRQFRQGFGPSPIQVDRQFRLHEGLHRDLRQALRRRGEPAHEAVGVRCPAIALPERRRHRCGCRAVPPRSPSRSRHTNALPAGQRPPDGLIGVLLAGVRSGRRCMRRGPGLPGSYWGCKGSSQTPTAASGGSSDNRASRGPPATSERRLPPRQAARSDALGASWALADPEASKAAGRGRARRARRSAVNGKRGALFYGFGQAAGARNANAGLSHRRG